MEEDIKILEELFDDVELSIGGWVDRLDKKERQALENLIKGYRELEEIAESYIWQSNFDMKFYEENYIPKSKIADKIKELVIEEETGYFDNSRIIRVLQELMEDK